MASKTVVKAKKKMVPDGRPQLPDDRVREVLLRTLRENPGCDARAILERCPVLLLGVRGYFRNSLGRLGVNDFGVYDDALFVVINDLKRGELRVVGRFNANCDPSQTGYEPGTSQPYAQLMPGVWPLRPGRHHDDRGRMRELTASEAHDLEADPSGDYGLGHFFSDTRAHGYFTVRRVKNEEATKLETGYFAINLHPGTPGSTSSWGCQTLPPDQYDEMRDAVYGALGIKVPTRRQSLDAWDGKSWVPFVLTEEKVA